MIRSILVVTLAAALPVTGLAQGTKLWSVSQFSEMERGTTQGVAIRSDGRLEPAPATSLLYTSSGNYIWSLATDAKGNAFAGSGGTASSSAVVTRIAPDGKSARIFSGGELAVQTIRTLADGNLLIATSPDGKVYRVNADGTGTPTVLFDPSTTAEKPKYLWDLAVIGTTVYVATGAPAAVYRIELARAGSGAAPISRLLFKTADQHIRCLLAAPDGTLWAGSDGAGVIYRIDPRQTGAKPFAAYAAAKREITALAIDAGGTVYAAGVGAKTAPNLPPLPVTGAVGISITFAAPGSATSATANTLVPEGSEIYRIAKDGLPSRLLALKDDVVYALTMHDGALLAASGNRGHVYRIDVHSADAGPQSLTDIAHVEAAQAMAFATVPGAVIVATSNSGKLFRLSDSPDKGATYTSEVFDAQHFSQWGRVELQSAVPAGFALEARSGNVPNPIEGWSEWRPVPLNAASLAAAGVPDARFLQWRAMLRANGSLDGVGVNYLPRNVAPVVDDIVVATGARVSPSPVNPPSQTVQVAFPADKVAQAISIVQETTSPLSAQKDKSAVTVRWSAHDDNGDELMFSVWYRGAGEQNWLLLKDKITDRFYSFDSALLPDGRYTVRVTASDAPVHNDADTLTSERESAEFTIDTTPPVPGRLTAQMQSGRIHATFEATDATSPIAHAEYAVDGGAWQYLEPVGKISDSMTERYDFTADIPKRDAAVSAFEHVIAVRVYDRFENMAGAKTVVR